MTMQRDPIFVSLDQLAGLADADSVADRMPDIRRRVKAARRRKTAGVALAGAAAAIAGAGVWQTLPEQSTAPDVTTPGDKASQTVEIQAQPIGADHLWISFTATGRSSGYVAGRAEAPAAQEGRPTAEYVGPIRTEVSLDGKQVFGSDAGFLECTEGTALAGYRMPFLTDEPFVLKVEEGVHEITVRAPYCDGGRLVDEPTQVTVDTNQNLPDSGSSVTGDVDGDGAEDTVTLLDFKGAGVRQWLVVDWGSGSVPETSSAMAMPADSRVQLRGLSDLDGNGSSEIPLDLGGGDTAAWRVILADKDRQLVEAQTVDARVGGAVLAADALENVPDPYAVWSTALLNPNREIAARSFVAYRFTRSGGLVAPAPVEVRRWVFEGTTLTLSEATTEGCWVEQGQQFGLSEDPC